MKNNRFERSTVNRMRVHVLPTDQFKTFSIAVHIGHPLSEQQVTSTALTPFVLRRGTQTYPETRQFRERLDDLYGAGFGFDVVKRGDYQIVQFRMDIINDRFVREEAAGLLGKGLAFIGEAIASPARENGKFVNKYVAAERETLRKRLEAVVNDKIRYAAERCIEEMCRNEPYRLPPLGRVADLDGLSADDLYSRYESWLANAAIDVYVVGQTTLQEVEALVAASFPVNRASEAGYEPAQASELRSGEEPRIVVEKMDVSQGKLNMGLRSDITYANDDYPAMLMYNGIFGGYPHSKLFINVREKASLAYYASSRLDGHKGILTVQSGIEIANYERAVAIIREQLEAMRAGTISELELSQTKAMIANQLRETQDSAFEMIAMDFNRVLSGRDRSVDGLIRDIESIDAAAIQRAAQHVALDTIYFLRDGKGE